MHVLVCPVCKGSMQEINKSGVAIDVCTVCRGVWLDRGELEKLSTLVGGSEGGGGASGRFLPERGRRDRDQLAQRENRRRDDDDDDDDDDDRRDRKRGLFGQGGRRRSSLLDFFD